MNIKETNFKFNGVLSPRTRTSYIVLHHRAGNGDVESIHKQHLNQGYSGIGYHFYVRKDGSVFRGRPINAVGAHCIGANNQSIGICFEGNFENETMTDTQMKAGCEFISYLKQIYPEAEVKKHSDFSSTVCPAKNFPFETIKKGEITMTVNEARKIIKEKAKLEENTINFLLCYKYGEDLIVKLAKAMN